MTPPAHLCLQDVGEDVIPSEHGEHRLEPRLELIRPRGVLQNAGDLDDELRDLFHDDREHHQDDAGEDAQHDDDRDEYRRPPRYATADQSRNHRFQAEREKQRCAHIKQDRRQRLHARDEQESETHTQQ